MRKTKGITLIALVITIIILLILSGISISALTNQGLFKNAKTAQKETEKAEAEQGQRLNEYEEELNKYLSNNDKKEEKLVDKVKDGTIKIGDYVKYIPDTANTTEILQELNTYSGSDKNTTSTLTQESLNWRVLDIKDGQVRLISELPTTSKITLSGYNGYNNAVYLLDKTCKTLYNSSLASNVQNLKIEDIQDHMSTDYSTIDSNYGKTFTPTEKYYPSILAEEAGQLGNGTEEKLGLSEQTLPIKQTAKNEANPLTVKYTNWYKSMTNTDFNDAKYYELFMNNGSNYSTYWMSSRCVFANTNGASFNVRNVNWSRGNAVSLYSSANSIWNKAYAFRPIITLNSNVQIDTENSGDGTTADTAYAIK